MIYPVAEDGAVVVHLVETKAVSRQGGTSIKDGKNPLLASPITLPLHIVVYRHPPPPTLVHYIMLDQICGPYKQTNVESKLQILGF